VGVIIGVFVGYILGSKAGAEGWSEVEEAWHTITTSEEVRDLVSGGVSMARDMVERRADVIASLLGMSDELARLRPAA
jgi:hypothetical protein